jgi:hypothetical protein
MCQGRRSSIIKTNLSLGIERVVVEISVFNSKKVGYSVLVIQDDEVENKWRQIGVAKGQFSSPPIVIFTRVSHFLAWIKSTIENN